MLISIGFREGNYTVLVTFDLDRRQPFIANMRTDDEVARLIATLNEAPERINVIFEGNLGLRRDTLVNKMRAAIHGQDEDV